MHVKCQAFTSYDWFCREVAADLAARGAAVTLACRNVKAAHAVAADIRCCCAEIFASRIRFRDACNFGSS